MLNDRELIIQLQEGSLNALGELYDRHQHMVYRTALAVTGDPASAADLLQDVFLRMHRFADRIDPERPLEPWLYRTTTNLTYTYIKRHKRLLRPLEDMAEWLSGSKKHSPSHIAEKDEEAPESATALVGDMKILIPMAGLIDKDAEAARLNKEIEKLQKEVQRVEGKLGNDNFVGKAPEAVVQKERDKLSDMQQALQGLSEQLEKINRL